MNRTLSVFALFLLCCSGLSTQSVSTDNLDGAGQLGDNSSYTAHNPKEILNDVKEAKAGQEHTMVLKTDSTLWVAGLNDFGQLGNGNTSNLGRFEKVLNNVAAISAGSYHSLVLKTDNTVWSTGSNGSSQLRIGRGTSDIKVYQQIKRH